MQVVLFLLVCFISFIKEQLRSFKKNLFVPLEETVQTLQKEHFSLFRLFRPFEKNFFVPLEETVQTLQKELFCPVRLFGPFKKNFFVPLDYLDPLERTSLSLQKRPFRPFRKNILVSLKNCLDPLERTFLFLQTIQTLQKELFLFLQMEPQYFKPLRLSLQENAYAIASFLIVSHLKFRYSL